MALASRRLRLLATATGKCGRRQEKTRRKDNAHGKPDFHDTTFLLRSGKPEEAPSVAGTAPLLKQPSDCRSYLLQLEHGFGHVLHGVAHGAHGICQLANQSYADWRPLHGCPHVTHGAHGFGHVAHLLHVPHPHDANAATANDITIAVTTTNSPNFFIRTTSFTCD